MPSIDRSSLHTLELALAALVLLFPVFELAGVLRLLPAWPTVGPVPVNPELVVPGLLGVVALAGALRDGISPGSVAIGILAAVTIWFAVTSMYTLYAVTEGGVFFGGLFTIASGFVLAAAVVLRRVANTGVQRAGARYLRYALDR